MKLNKDNVFTIIFFLIIFSSQKAFGGPPFFTDDPEPVDFKHWEYYISTSNTVLASEWMGTSPHFEVNYGLLPNVQIHLLAPLNYDYTKQNGFKAGYSYTEVGFKYRFVQETDYMPQIGIFPVIEIPTIKNADFGNGETKIFIPVWLQKSWGKLTSYGGAGYWINPGTGNKNWIFSGLEVQYDLIPVLTLGGEIYHQTADTQNGESLTGFNVGGSLNPSQKFHIIFSVGHSLSHENLITNYLGLLWTI